MAADTANTEHGIIVQDTAWEGYEEIPDGDHEGYGDEDNYQLTKMDVKTPTYSSRLVSDLLPELFRDILPTAIPRIRRKWWLRSEAAACLYKGAAAGTMETYAS